MRFEDLSWFDVEKYLQKDNRLMVVLGACEQHGYLSLLTDSKIPLALADAASQKTGVLIAPVVNYGISPYFIEYPGSFSFPSIPGCAGSERSITKKGSIRLKVTM